MRAGPLLDILSKTILLSQVERCGPRLLALRYHQRQDCGEPTRSRIRRVTLECPDHIACHAH